VQRAMDIVSRDQRNAPTILKPADAAESIKLTGREKEVMSWAARGKTVADTAQILGISPETVKKYMQLAIASISAYVRDNIDVFLLLAALTSLN